MHYKKIKVDGLVIEFLNNWTGQETVLVNGQMVSRKSSVWGVDHPFTSVQQGHTIRYVLTSKVTASMVVKLDLMRKLRFILRDIPVESTVYQYKKPNKHKNDGLKHLKNYDLEDALDAFQRAIDEGEHDPEIYFSMACAYSVMEDAAKGYECIKLAVEAGLKEQEIILTHDMLAYLRMQDAFEAFLDSGYSEYDLDLLSK